MHNCVYKLNAVIKGMFRLRPPCLLTVGQETLWLLYVGLANTHLKGRADFMGLCELEKREPEIRDILHVLLEKRSEKVSGELEICATRIDFCHYHPDIGCSGLIPLSLTV